MPRGGVKVLGWSSVYLLSIYYQRPMEWFGLAKPCKITECHHSSALPGPPQTHVPKGHICVVFEQLQAWAPHLFPRQLCQCLTPLSVKKLFPVSSLNLPRHSPRPFPLILRISFPSGFPSSCASVHGSTSLVSHRFSSSRNPHLSEDSASLFQSQSSRDVWILPPALLQSPLHPPAIPSTLSPPKKKK